MIIRQPEHNDLHPDNITALCSLINLAYREAEAGLLQPDSHRISESDLHTLLQSKAILLAEDKGNIIGCVKLSLIDPMHAMFGMLVTSQACRGAGIGRQLVAAAEQWARNHGCSVMCLELLVPTHWQQQHKEFLKAWYGRLGYVKHAVKAFDKADDQITECDFYLYKKNL